METVVLKKSCDACTASKVKCSGGNPCEKCLAKGLQCFYSPRKRRKKPKKKSKVTETELRNRYGFDPTSSAESLVEWERRSWSVFFTLYKHYGTSCSLYWFNRQLNKMRNYLAKQGNEETLGRLTSWMNALNIDVAAITAQVEKCRLKCFVVRNTLPLKVDGVVKTGKTNYSSSDTLNPKLPFLKLVFRDPTGELKIENEEFMVQCNTPFTQVFGINQKALEEQLKWTAGGFLPFGGDLLARLVNQEKDLLAYCQIMAIKFNSMGPPEKIPTVREIPSCHIFEVNMKEEADSGRLTPKKCLIKVVHREIIERNKFEMEISMEFTPLSPYEHLLNSNGQINVSSDIEEIVEGDVLENSSVVKPYATNQRKRPLADFEDDVDYFLGAIPATPGGNGEIFDNVMNSISKNLAETKQGGELEEEFVFEAEQDKWLDGLLSWANEQQLVTPK